MIYFVSDIHLGFYKRDQDKIIENSFLNFLDTIEKDCTTLILLGDIFDYWFEYKFTIPKYYYRTLAKLEHFVSKNINVIYIMGNHDFGHKTFFLEELGIKISKKDLNIELMEKKFFLTHGDDKLPKDYGYKILKKVLNNKTCQFLFSTIHPTLAIGIAKFCSKSSRKYRTDTTNVTDNKDDKLISFAEKIINQNYDFIVIGHTHKALHIDIQRADKSFGTYINLGSWLNAPHYAKFDGKKIELNAVK
ncbi:MAG: UDP-2,3-diacylglucosamine diphosphatase [Bacteroidetes bacterium]|nr:UDP-2,3-diacylglucosamine diphosphatase [Bacteroidota bacterium]